MHIDALLSIDHIIHVRLSALIPIKGRHNSLIERKEETYTAGPFSGSSYFNPLLLFSVADESSQLVSRVQPVDSNSACMTHYFCSPSTYKVKWFPVLGNGKVQLSWVDWPTYVISPDGEVIIVLQNPNAPSAGLSAEDMIIGSLTHRKSTSWSCTVQTSSEPTQSH